MHKNLLLQNRIYIKPLLLPVSLLSALFGAYA